MNRDFMAWCLAKVRAKVRDVEIRARNEPQIVCDGERPDIEQDVVRRAKTEDVCGFVGAVMRRAQRTDVCGLGVGATGRLKALAADLTTVAVHPLDPLCDCRIANNPVADARAAGGGRRCRLLTSGFGPTDVFNSK